ncbi:MAG: hypothetical protein ABNH03_00745 [Alteromonas sp.]|uniref:hypothetical protein n=1 Tax=Alteromonas sp. TaxID=232 RepID=UPI0032D8C875
MLDQHVLNSSRYDDSECESEGDSSDRLQEATIDLEIMESAVKIIGHVKRFWKFHSLIIGAFGICALTLGCAIHEPSFYEGTWVITDTYQNEKSSQNTSKSRVLGSSFTYSATSAQLDQFACEVPEYDTQRLSSDDFYSQYKVDPQRIGFSRDDVTKIELTCASDVATLGRTLLIQQSDNAVIPANGTFFRLEKATI